MAVDLAVQHDLPVVATNDGFLNKDDFDAHEIRVAIHDGYTLDDARRPKRFSNQQYLRTQDEMCSYSKDIPSIN